MTDPACHFCNVSVADFSSWRARGLHMIELGTSVDNHPRSDGGLAVIMCYSCHARAGATHACEPCFFSQLFRSPNHYWDEARWMRTGRRVIPGPEDQPTTNCSRCNLALIHAKHLCYGCERITSTGYNAH